MPKNPSMPMVVGSPGSAPPEDGKTYFDAPKGYDMDGKKPGDEIEFVATAKVEDDGRLCLTKMDGMDMDGDDKKEPDEGDDKGYGDFVGAAMPGEDGAQPQEEM